MSWLSFSAAGPYPPTEREIHFRLQAADLQPGELGDDEFGRVPAWTERGNIAAQTSARFSNSVSFHASAMRQNVRSAARAASTVIALRLVGNVAA
jgi:hypothetical protein